MEDNLQYEVITECYLTDENIRSWKCSRSMRMSCPVHPAVEITIIADMTGVVEEAVLAQWVQLVRRDHEVHEAARECLAQWDRRDRRGHRANLESRDIQGFQELLALREPQVRLARWVWLEPQELQEQPVRREFRE